jgi:hypothetical protein
MSNERPAWIEEIVGDDDSLETDDTPVERNKRPLSPVQILVLGVLGLILCGVFGSLAGVVVFRDSLFGSPAQESAAVSASTSAEAVDLLPTATSTPTFTPFPTAALPEPAATPEPTPTATYAVAPAFINKDKIRDITVFVEKWRELSLPEPLPIEFLTRRQLRDQWGEQSYEQETLEAVQTQQQFYTALGLIEPEVDLMQAALDTQSDILLGYYTPDEKVMYIIAESVNMFAQEEMTFAHEYVHALQDYHFDLGTYLNNNGSADALLAARSLPEGDARLVEELFTYQNITKDQLDYTVYRYLFQEHPEIEGVSPALGIFTYFPYTAGEYFVIYLYIEGNFTWDKVNQAYRNPPISTEQVMHPEKYLAGERAVVVNLPDLAPVLGGAWHELDRDVLGEAGFLVWLIDQVESQVAIDGAAGWDGDAYTLWTNENNQRIVAELSQWESNAEASQFLEAFTGYMNLREENNTRYEEGDVQFWEDKGGITLLSRQGQQVLILIAPDRAILDQVRSQFANF